MQYPAYFLIAPDYRIELARTGLLHEVFGIFVECLIVLVTRLRLHFLSLSQTLDGHFHLLLCAAGIFQDAARRGVDLQEGEQYGLYAHKLVALFLGDVLRFDQNLIGGGAQIGFSPLHPGLMLNLGSDERVYLLTVDSQLLEEITGHILAFFQDTCQQMHRLNGLLLVALRNAHRSLHGLLGFDCKFLECHIRFSFL